MELQNYFNNLFAPEGGGEESGQGNKSAYTDKQKRQADHIEEGYEDRGVSKGEAERRAWATVNKMTGGGKKRGSGRGKKVNKAPARKGGRKGGRRKAGRANSAGRRSATRRRSAARRGGRKTAARRGGRRGAKRTTRRSKRR